jgi:hypothetical protein
LGVHLWAGLQAVLVDFSHLVILQNQRLLVLLIEHLHFAVIDADALKLFEFVDGKARAQHGDFEALGFYHKGAVAVWSDFKDGFALQQVNVALVAVVLNLNTRVGVECDAAAIVQRLRGQSDGGDLHSEL